MVYDDRAAFVGPSDERRQAVGEDSLFQNIVEAIIERNQDRTEEFAEQANEEGVDPLDVLQDGRDEDRGRQVRQTGAVPVGAGNANCTRAGVQHVDSVLAEIDQGTPRGDPAEGREREHAQRTTYSTVTP